jgi:hypothetical protein
MNTERQFPTNTESGASAEPSRHSNARSRTATRVRAARRIRVDTNPRGRAAAPAETPALVTGPAPAESPRAPGAFAALAEHLDERDRPILGMLLAGDHPDDMAQLMGLSAETLGLRVRTLVTRLGAVRAAGEPDGERPAGRQSQMT